MSRVVTRRGAELVVRLTVMGFLSIRLSAENPSYADVSKRTFIHNNVVARIYRSPAVMPECSAWCAVPLQCIDCPLVLVGKDEYR